MAAGQSASCQYSVLRPFLTFQLLFCSGQQTWTSYRTYILDPVLSFCDGPMQFIVPIASLKDLSSWIGSPSYCYIYHVFCWIVS